MAEVKMTFNGESRDYIRVLHDLERSAFAPITRELLEVPGFSGAYLTGTRTGVREISVPIKIKGDDYSDLQALKEDLAAWLIQDEPKELTFSDEPDRIYYAVIEGDFNTEDIINHGTGELKFLCPDPYKYGDEVSADITEGGIVTNTGSADAKPIFDLEVKQNVTFAMVQSGVEDYMMIGVPTEIDQEVVNTRTQLFSEDGTTISKWTPAPANLGGSDGKLGYNGTGIVAIDYGTGANYHGPVSYLEVPLTEDFEIEMHGQLYANVPAVGRFGFSFFDDQSRQLGSFMIGDTSRTVHSTTATGRVGPYRGGYVNTPISPKNYSIRLQDYSGYFRVKRVGNTYEFYVARVRADGVHTNKLTKTWTTVDSAHLGPLKYVTMVFDTFGANKTPYINRIDYIKAWSISKATDDQTPYIAYPGDVITFNHVDRSILINGIDRTDLKDFGARYFTLGRGDNLISVYPQEAFNSRIRYKERFK